MNFRKKVKRLHSVRVSVFILLLLTAALTLSFLTVCTVLECRKQVVSERITEVTNYGKTLANQMTASGYLAAQGMEINAEITAVADVFDGRIIVVDSNLKVVADTYNYEIGKILIARPVIECIRGIRNGLAEQGEDYIEVTVPIVRGDGKENVGVIFLRASLLQENSVARHVENFMVVFDIAAMCIVFLAALHTAGRIARPFQQIIASIQHVTEGYLDEEMAIRGYYEVEEISNSFNEMLARMKKVEDSRQEFVSNVSHELKTPMTSLKVLADSLNAQENVPVEIYREFMADITAEIERENEIINDLLSMVRLDQKDTAMHIAQVSINEFLEIILKRIRPLAQQRNIEMIFESFRPVLAEVDEVKLSLAVSNLIENAVKYNVDEGTVRVSLNADHRYFYITVADSGIGIPQKAQPFIFDRFYRVDKARSRESGGTGLGLAITKSVVLRHKGTIKVYSRENEGTTFTVRIPLSYIA